jgi:tetratricopeptide (TPR) repeat protein
MLLFAGWCELLSVESCQVLECLNKVEWRPADGDWAPVANGMPLALGSLLRTGEFSRVSIQLPGGSIVRLNELSAVVLQAAPDGITTQRMQLLQGALYLFNRQYPAEVDVVSGHANGAIRGTEFVATVPATGGLRLDVIAGVVDLTQEGVTLRLENGESGEALPGAPPVILQGIELLRQVQWCLYYPEVLDVSQLTAPPETGNWWPAAVAAFQRGTPLLAWQLIPQRERDDPGSDASALLLASIALSAGQVVQAETWLNRVRSAHSGGRALQAVLSLVRGDVDASSAAASIAEPESSSEWLARSYIEQARYDLPAARTATERALALSPNWGQAWGRRAALAFALGDIAAAQSDLAKARQLSPENGYLAVLEGYLSVARQPASTTRTAFDHAVHTAPGLGDAWLGRGIARLRSGDAEGLRDLTAAAAIEPRRSILRSYLGKAWLDEGDVLRATREFRIAESLDPQDPTVPYYRAIGDMAQGRPLAAVRQYTTAIELNNSRAVYRSRHLLDDDRAVRRAHLADAYRQAGLAPFALIEAQAALLDTDLNPAAWRFLADAYGANLSGGQVERSAQTRWFNARFLANLLGGPGDAGLSMKLAQNEYSSLFAVPSVQHALAAGWDRPHGFQSQYGCTFNGTSASIGLELDYASRGVDVLNDGYTSSGIEAVLQWQPGLHDQFLLSLDAGRIEHGDIYFRTPGRDLHDPDFSRTERREPFVFAGWHHARTPGRDTLLLAGWQRVLERVDDQQYPVRLYLGNPDSQHLPPHVAQLRLALRRVSEAATAEILHHETLGAASFSFSASAHHSRISGQPAFPAADINSQPGAGDGEVHRLQSALVLRYPVRADLLLEVNVGYATVEIPRNLLLPPFDTAIDRHAGFQGGAGLTWRPGADTRIQAAYHEAISGYSLDAPVQLSATHLAGLPVSERSILPENLTGSVPGAGQTIWSTRLDHRWNTNVRTVVEHQSSRASGGRGVGALLFVRDGPDEPLHMYEQVRYQRESIGLRTYMLAGDVFSLDAGVFLSKAGLDGVVYRDATLAMLLSATEFTLPNGTPAGPTRSRLLEASLGLQWQPQAGWTLRGQTTGYWQEVEQQHPQGMLTRHPRAIRVDLQIRRMLLRGRGEIVLAVRNAGNSSSNLDPLGFHDRPLYPRALEGSFNLRF